jgi:hypothetical protein
MRSTRLRILSMIVVGLALAGVVSAEPRQPDPSLQVGVEDFLREARNRAALRARLGAATERCVELDASFELCEWSLSNREAGWKAVADAIKTRDRVAVLCVVPTTDGDRQAGTCGAYAQRSNRSQFKPPGPGPGGNRKGARSSPTAVDREEGQRIAQSWLDAAVDIVQMSRLLGAIPDVCMPPSGGERSCVWRATARTYGHGTIAASIKVGGSKKVRLHCQLPEDGTPRAPGSCSARVGN